jgi:hypothetical protein
MGRPLPRWALPAVGLGIPLLAVLLAIAVLQPYYGVVDDAALLGYVGQVDWSELPSAWAHRVWDDIWSWGMVRPFYWAFAYLHYRAGSDSPFVLYAVNWAVTGVVLALGGLCLGRAFRVPAAKRGLFLGAYGAAVFVYPWTLDLFAFPSYQEKWVVLGAALGFLWFAEPRERMPAWAWYAISVGVIALGSMTKAQFLIFVPAFVLLVLDAHREGRAGWLRVLAVAAAGIVAALLVRAVAWHGSYTEGYGLSNVPDQLRSKYLWLLSAFALAWAVYVLVRHVRGAGTLLRDLIPLAVYVSFVAVFAQWPGGFLYSVIGFTCAGAFALAVSRVRSDKLAAVVFVGALVWACAWIWVRTDELYSSLASIGEFARSAPARALAANSTPVYISCEEGSDAIAGYVRREQGLPLSVRPREAAPWSSASGLAPPAAFRYALVDDRLCPADIDLAQWDAVWRPSSGGFTLYRRRAG